MLKGSIAALITPFKDDGIDEAALRKLVDWHIEKGTDGLVPVGTTGESPTVTHDEHRKVIEIVIEQAAKRVPVIAGTGSNSTAEAISLTKFAAEAGADAALMITPYYNKPSQEGIFQHFKKIADSVDIPIVLYNHQGRTGTTIQPETIKALSEVGNFVAVKDASGGINYSAEVLELTGGKVAVFSGNDSWTLSLMAIGAVGCISVVANVVPTEMHDMIVAFEQGAVKKSQEIFFKILPLMKAMELDVNPVPVKEALGLLGVASPSLRLPLVAIDDKKRQAIAEELKKAGLLK